MGQEITLDQAGEALRALGLGAVRLRYRSADHLIPRDTFTIWIEHGASEWIGIGRTPQAAFEDALKEKAA